MLFPVILSGGVGSRLWPLSRAQYPKQLLSLINGKTLLQQTIQRLNNTSEIIVVCQESHRFLVQEQLEEINIFDATIILEPAPRNTAPAIALAAWKAIAQDNQAMLLVMPADHLILDLPAFHSTLKQACDIAEQDYLVTFGVKPDYAETGYGYIKTGLNIGANGFAVQCFIEKPDSLSAQKYLQSKDYFWNSGLFVFKAAKFLSQLKQHAPSIYSHTRKAFAQSKQDQWFIRPEAHSFQQCDKQSIDYAVMEKTNDAAVVPTQMGWSDIGSWQALWQAAEKDENNNASIGDVLIENCNNCYIHSEHRLVTAVDVDDLVIVETADAIMVSNKSSAQNVKLLVEKLKQFSRIESNLHRKVFRPWGSFEGIDIDEKFQVKRITVKPGGILSLQKHQFRAEHWIVVKGVATVTRDEEVFNVNENESTYIPLGAVHRLENKLDTELELIEIQTGTYFGEDDIVRLEDVYNRNQSE